MPRGFTDEEKIRIQERLIESGSRLFGRYGYDKTSLDKIVEATGIAKGSFYKFFPNKEMFYIHCLAAFEERMEREVISPLIENASDPETLIGGLIELALAGFEEYPLLRSWMETPSRERILAKLTDEQRERMDKTDLVRMERVTERIREMRGDFTASPEELSALFRALFFLNGHKEMIHTDFDRFSDFMKSALTKGVLP